MTTSIPATYLVGYAKAQLGNPYWFGCYGQFLSASVWEQFKRIYPQYYTAERLATAKQRGDFGKKGHDCRGLLLGALWTYPKNYAMAATYTPSQDQDANAIYNNSTDRGPISSIPPIIGTAVWKNNHIGIVTDIKDNGDFVITESLGFNYGTVERLLKNRNFTNWCFPAFVDYKGAYEIKPKPDIPNFPTTPTEGSATKVNIELSVLRRGSKGAEVKTLQILLNEKCKTGRLIMTDGDYGPLTEQRVRDYQSSVPGLEVDGVVGKNTWTKLLTC